MTSLSPVVSKEKQLCAENWRSELTSVLLRMHCVKHHKAKKMTLNELAIVKHQSAHVRKVVYKSNSFARKYFKY